MDIEQDKGGAHIASSVAWGYGPALAMPTLMGMMGQQEEASTGQDGGQVRVHVCDVVNFGQTILESKNVKDHYLIAGIQSSLANQ